MYTPLQGYFFSPLFVVYRVKITKIVLLSKYLPNCNNFCVLLWKSEANVGVVAKGLLAAVLLCKKDHQLPGFVFSVNTSLIILVGSVAIFMTLWIKH